MNPENSDASISDLKTAILDLQYETQHFGLHPRTFLDIVYNVFFENSTASLTQMKQHLIQEFKEVLPPYSIKVQTDIFLQEIGKKLDKSIDKLEVYLNTNVFSIDKHVIFPEDEVHVKNPCSKEDDEKLDAEIEELKQKIREEKAKQFSLKRKISEQKEVQQVLLSLQEDIKYMCEIANQEGVTPENVESFYSDLTKLIDFKMHPL